MTKPHLIITIELPYLACGLGHGGDNTVGFGLQMVYYEVR